MGRARHSGLSKHSCMKVIFISVHVSEPRCHHLQEISEAGRSALECGQFGRYVDMITAVGGVMFKQRHLLHEDLSYPVVNEPSAPFSESLELLGKTNVRLSATK